MPLGRDGPNPPSAAAGFSYHKPVLTVLIIFIGLSAFEIPIVDLIVHQWPAVRIAFLILGIWGVTWMFGRMQDETDIEIELERPTVVRLPGGERRAANRRSPDCGSGSTTGGGSWTRCESTSDDSPPAATTLQGRRPARLLK